MAKAKRRYSEKTIKLLFGPGSHCAYPDCTKPNVQPATANSPAVNLGEICHIHAAADAGPRGRPGLTAAQKNAAENLIVLCGYHHGLVDGQPNDYPAETLLKWKADYEDKFRPGTARAIRLQEAAEQIAYTRDISDKEIDSEVTRIRQARFLPGFDTKTAVTTLAARVERTQLAGGSNRTRARALAWCARLLVSNDDTRPRTSELIEKSRALTPTEEADIAQAFLVASEDKNRALSLLAKLDSAAARSAALRIVTNADNAEMALAWVGTAGLSLTSFDAEGKLVYLLNKIGLDRWAEALAEVAAVTDSDITEAPVLLHALASIALAQVVPDEFRSVVLGQVPFEVGDFPLAATASGLESRRRAVGYFERMAEFAARAGVKSAANLAADYALWLRLRDPEAKAAALDELRANMRDPAQSLRRLHMALQFGIDVDLDAAERAIDHIAALSGGGTADEAQARLALAFAQKGPKGAAAYIAKHRAQLYVHLNKPAIQNIEVQMLAQANETAAARERLAEALADGLSEADGDRLRRMIAEAEGADPAAERKKLYEQTGKLTDLGNLVHFLDEKKAWLELIPYAVELFERTDSLEDAVRVGRALYESDQYAKAHTFLTQHSGLVEQSLYLKTIFAWVLYGEGQFGEASAVLDQLSAIRDDHGDRVLRANLSIASGKWPELVGFCAHEWNHRDERTAAELLAAAGLAVTVGSPHAEDLVRAAAAKSPDDANVLAAAYFHAAHAGWEDNAEVGGWLARAAALSGGDGPLKSVSMKEISEQKPAWDKRESDIWVQLNEGKIPACGAAYLLNRSFIDFALLQSLSDLSEPDLRRRGVVYGFSGARSANSSQAPKIVALELGAILTLARLDLLQTVIDTYESVVIPNSTLGWLFNEKQKAALHQPSRIKAARLKKQLVADGALRLLPTAPLDAPLALEVGVGLAQLLAAVTSKSATGDGIPRYVIRSAPVHRIGSLMEEEADLANYSSVLCSCQHLLEALRIKGALTLDELRRGENYLRLHERRWPNEPDIADGAELYLDDLSTTYLQTIGALGSLKRAGFTPFITEEEDNEANRLIRFEDLVQHQSEIVEAVRGTLAAGLARGRVRAVRAEAPGDEKVLKSHPTFGILGMDESVDAIVIDDRYFNRHLHVDIHDRRTPILSTLDILDDLTAKNVLSPEQKFGHRTSLRRAGFQLIPVTDEELTWHLSAAPYASGAMAETAELRAIRESLLKARMSRLMQIPHELPWLHRSMVTITQTIRAVWKDAVDAKEAVARANWLVRLLDLRGFSPSAIPGNERNFALFAYAAHVQSLAFSREGLPPDRRDAYHAWLDDELIQPMKDTEPEMFTALVEQARALIRRATRDAAEEFEP
jgi:fructose-specific component phosphotransferase system IIB-like protein